VGIADIQTATKYVDPAPGKAMAGKPVSRAVTRPAVAR